MMDMKILEWAATQGLGFVIAVLVLFFYRRDVHAALNSWKEQTKILTELVRDNATAMQENSDAVRANTDAVQAMERKLPHLISASIPMQERGR